MLGVTCCLTAVIFAVIQQCNCDCNDLDPKSKKDALKYLDYLEQEVCFVGRFNQQSATFNYFTNITDENLKIYNEELSKPPLFDAEYVSFDWDSFNDPYLKRQAQYYNLLKKPIDPEIYKSYADSVAALVAIGDSVNETCQYNSTVCGNQAYKVMRWAIQNSSDPKELQFYWEQNRDPKASLARPLWKAYVDSSNKLAQANGYANRAEEAMGVFEVPPIPEFKQTMLDLWEQIKPFYQQLHAFLRTRLRDKFGPKVVPKRGPIPVYLFSSFLGEDIATWVDTMYPYPEVHSSDISDEMRKQNYTVKKMIGLVEDFYESLGLEQLPDSFYKYSMFEQPTDGREVSCDATSYDFYNRKDFRLQFCTQVSFPSFTTLVHEFGHIHNFLVYKDLPCCFRDNTKAVLVETIADTMILAVSSYKYLHRIGLKPECKQDPKTEINDLYEIYRDTLGYGPISLLEDLWRWQMFTGEVPEKHYNQAFWDLRLQYQGIVPPKTKRNIEEFIDAANHFIMLDDTPSMNYFISFIAEFQFYEGLCIIAGQYDPNDPNSEPLHNCDLYGSKKAGKKWHEILTVGVSKPWTAILETLTGKAKVDASSVLKYFEPLHKFLIAENKRRGEFIGWE